MYVAGHGTCGGEGVRLPRAALLTKLSAVSRRLLAPAVVLGLSGCVRHYKPPTEQQPHAVLKVRRTYERTFGSHLRELVNVDDHRALTLGESSRVADVPRTDAILVHPVQANFSVLNTFFHMEERLVTETYHVQESYTSYESYSCGSGSYSRMCGRSVTRYRSVPRQRTVWRTVEVPDASCASGFRFTPQNGRAYLLQYTFQEHGACSLSCFEQTSSAPGAIEQKQCVAEVAPPK